MKVLIHVLKTDNEFSRDSVAERVIEELIASLTDIEDKEICRIDFYDNEKMTALKSNLLKKDDAVFHLIFPAGQTAQQNLEVHLGQSKLTNSFIIYNGNWYVLDLGEQLFGDIVGDLRYNTGNPEFHTDHLADTSLEIGDAHLRLMLNIAKEAFKDYPIQRSGLDSMVKVDNFKERQTKKCMTKEHLTRIKQELPGKIKEAVRAYQNKANVYGRFFDKTVEDSINTTATLPTI